MSREIDLTKQLDADELRYLVDRDMWDALRENARNLDLPEPNLPSARGIRMQVPRKQLRNTDAFDRIADQLGVSLPSDEETEQPPAGQAENPPPPSGPQPTDWTKLTVVQLKEEMDKRRREYEAEDDQEGVKLMTYAGDARKDDLVSALQLDDEAGTDDETDN